MSTRDTLDFISDAYKEAQNGRNAHSLPLMAEYISGITNLWTSTLPNAGSLLVINEEPMNANSGCTITLSCRRAFVDHFGTGYAYDKQYYYPVYSQYNASGQAIVETYSVYFDSGTRINQQKIVSGIFHEITALTVSPLQHVSVYGIGDNGIKLLYGTNTEVERDMIYYLERGHYSLLDTCFRCNGEKLYSGVECPDCSGYGFVGQNAKNWMLYRQGASRELKKSSENDETFSLRVWAKEWQCVPTMNNIKEYISHFMRVPTGEISITTQNQPECFFWVKFPANLTGSKYTDYQELIDNISPAGMNGVIIPYWSLPTTGTVLTNSGSVVNFIKFFELDPTAWHNDWGQQWYGNAIKFFNVDGSITGIIYSGDQIVTNTGYFSGITYSGYKTILFNDQVF